ncbi:MAG: hypothetical protein QN174_04135 [Armatimonadota bacterium]|nr:hypothetical protein [Armatimonadota bacterium]MDR7421122.1 hypothetical protein [Armatimonadota bacterium]MDR7457476.1 hypothetical protein [Armatimonadota bacterium]MDR7496132.1 hypothetical protein [Armatimonadota bacterium]MDR7512614.1 hypothetical protein [Armatimonadota bacterium]
MIVVLDGTPGVTFEGSYGTPLQTTSVRGTVPARYTVKTAVAVVASFSMTGGDGELVVRLLVDGREVQRRGTTVPFRTVIVSQQFSQ